MYTIPAQEIKRRSIAAVDDMVSKGDVHIIRNNRPPVCSVVSGAVSELPRRAGGGLRSRVLASLEDYKAGNVQFASAEELLRALDEEDSE